MIAISSSKHVLKGGAIFITTAKKFGVREGF